MIKGIVAKGGGVRGIAYIGCLTVLEQAGLLANLERTAGTSVGSLPALLLALKYTAAQMKQIVMALDFGSLQSGFNIFRELTEEGLYSNKHLLTFIESIVRPKLGQNATFADLKANGFLDYRCVASIPAIQDIQVFSAANTGSTKIIQATVTSASIPGFFPKMRLEGMKYDGVDGGLIENFYITAFDKEQVPNETLGLFLHNYTPTQPRPTGSLPQMLVACFESALSSQDVIDFNDPGAMSRSIIIDTLGISSTDFHISEADKDRLFQSGIDAGKKYITSKNASL